MIENSGDDPPDNELKIISPPQSQNVLETPLKEYVRINERLFPFSCPDLSDAGTPIVFKAASIALPRSAMDFRVDPMNKVLRNEQLTNVVQEANAHDLLNKLYPQNQLPLDINEFYEFLLKVATIKDRSLEEILEHLKLHKSLDGLLPDPPVQQTKAKTNKGKGKEKEDQSGKGTTEKEAPFDSFAPHNWLNLPGSQRDNPNLSSEEKTAIVLQNIVDLAVASGLFVMTPLAFRKWSAYFSTHPVKSLLSDMQRKPDLVLVKDFVEVEDSERNGERLDWRFIEGFGEIRNPKADISPDIYVDTVGDELNNRTYETREAQPFRRFSPSFGLIGSTCRLNHSDRAGNIYATGFNINTHPKEFLHLIVGMSFAPDYCLGHDPNTRFVPLKAPEASQDAISTILVTVRPEPDIVTEENVPNLNSAVENGTRSLRPRPVQMTDRFRATHEPTFPRNKVVIPKAPVTRTFASEAERALFEKFQLSEADRPQESTVAVTVKGKEYTVLGPVYRSVMNHGRATQVFKVECEGEKRALKDSWPLSMRVPSEVDLQLMAQKANVPGIPRLIDWEDVCIYDRLDSCDNNRGTHYYNIDRIHRRLIFEDCCVPLSNFKSRREYASVFRDYLETLCELEKAGILHCDVSFFNTMIADTDDEIRKGALVDLDYAKLKNQDQMKEYKMPPMGVSNLPKKEGEEYIPPLQVPAMSNREVKIREENLKLLQTTTIGRGFITGTHPFMAAELLREKFQKNGRQKNVKHTAAFDMESTYYVFLYGCTLFKGPHGLEIENELPQFILDWNNINQSENSSGLGKQGLLSLNYTQYERLMKASLTEYMLPLLPLLWEFNHYISVCIRDNTEMKHEDLLAIFDRNLKVLESLEPGMVNAHDTNPVQSTSSTPLELASVAMSTAQSSGVAGMTQPSDSVSPSSIIEKSTSNEPRSSEAGPVPSTSLSGDAALQHGPTISSSGAQTSNLPLKAADVLPTAAVAPQPSTSKRRQPSYMKPTIASAGRATSKKPSRPSIPSKPDSTSRSTSGKKNPHAVQRAAPNAVPQTDTNAVAGPSILPSWGKVEGSRTMDDFSVNLSIAPKKRFNAHPTAVVGPRKGPLVAAPLEDPSLGMPFAVKTVKAGMKKAVVLEPNSRASARALMEGYDPNEIPDFEKPEPEPNPKTPNQPPTQITPRET